MNVITEQESFTVYEQTVTPDHNAASETHTYAVTELHVLSDDVLYSGTERDEGLVIVKANSPVRFIIGEWPREVSDETVYVDDEAVEGINIQEGTFTLPAEFVHDDFKVQVKAGELESQELYINAIEQ